MRNESTSMRSLLGSFVVVLPVGSICIALFAIALWVHLDRAHLKVPPRVPLIFSDVTVVNPCGRRSPHQVIAIEGGRITAVFDSDSSGQNSRFAGRFVLPGLIDMHVHFPPRWLPGDDELFNLLFLRAGVTAVREASGFDDAGLRLRRRVAAGSAVGPRIFSCGQALDGVPSLMRVKVVGSRAEGRQAVGELVDRGADCVKVFSDVGLHALAGISEEAMRHGVPIIGHAPHRVRLADAGIDEVQHLTGILVPSEASSEPSRADLDSMIGVSSREGIAHTPTLVHFLRAGQLVDGRRVSREPPLRSYYTRVLWDPTRFPVVRDMSGRDLEKLGNRVHWMKDVVRRLHKSGVPVFLGTDTPNPLVAPGESLHEELRLFADAGLTLEEAWYAGTRAPGRHLGLEGLGLVAPGAPADLTIYRQDPTRDLAALDTLEAVVADGRLYLQEDLDRAFDASRSGALRAFADAVVSLLGRAMLPRSD